MPAAIKWEAGYVDRSDVLTTELNSLANDARTNAGTELANQTNLDQYGILKVSVTFGSNPSSGAYVNIYAVRSPDGDGYEDGSSTVDPGSHTLVATIPVRATTSAQVLISRPFTLEPAPTKFILENKTGQAFPASGSTVKLYTTNDEAQT
jgi:hypothetical protein